MSELKYEREPEFSIVPVVPSNLSDADFEDLRDFVDREGRLTQSLGGGGGHLPYYSLVVQAKHFAPYLLGAVGKLVSDVIAARVKDWLAKRPEDRKIEIYGPNDEVVSVVKVKNDIQIIRK